MCKKLFLFETSKSGPLVDFTWNDPIAFVLIFYLIDFLVIETDFTSKDVYLNGRIKKRKKKHKMALCIKTISEITRILDIISIQSPRESFSKGHERIIK